MHDAGAVQTGGILPERHTVDTEDPFQEGGVRGSHIPDGMHTVILQLPCRGRSTVEKLGTVERPDLLPEIVRRDRGDGIGLLHIAAQLGKDLIKRYTDADG